MDICVNKADKTVEIWLTNTEKTDMPLRESLKSVFADYKSGQYMVVVFESGKDDVFEGTRDLLLHNRTQIM